MILSVHQPQYIPWLGFFNKLAQSDVFVFLDQVQYKPREWQNRNKIRIKGGSLWLTVPVLHTGERQAICDVRVDNSASWEKEHWKNLCNWYSKAPFFEHYRPFFEEVYSTKWELLMDLNIHLTKFVLKELGISIPVHLESEIGTTKQRSDRIIEIAQKLNTDTYLTGEGGKNYLEEDKFDAAGIKLVYQNYQHPEYRQNFVTADDPFLSNMSIIDLLFNEGPQSRHFI